MKLPGAVVVVAVGGSGEREREVDRELPPERVGMVGICIEREIRRDGGSPTFQFADGCVGIGAKIGAGLRAGLRSGRGIWWAEFERARCIFDLRRDDGLDDVDATRV